MEFTKTSNFTLLVNKGPVSKPDAPNNHLHTLYVSAMGEIFSTIL